MRGGNVIFFALVALFVMEVTSAHITNAYVRAVQNLKKNTQILMDDLIEYQRTAQLDLNYELMEMKRQDIKLIRARTDRLQEEIRKAVDKAKQDGKNTEICYEKLELDVQHLHSVLDLELKVCIDGMETILMPVSEDAQKVIQDCIDFQFELDRILRDCTSARISEMNRCIAKKLVGANTTHRKMKLAGTKVKNTGHRISRSAKSSAKLCALRPTADARREVLNIGISARKCVKDVSKI